MAVVASTGTQRIVTVLFADVVGSTAIGEQLGPERSKFLFDEIVSLIAGEVRRFDGTVAQLLGDGLFAVFGAPVGHEDDAERAVRAALAIQDAIATYGEELRSGYGVELAVRVAVNTGPVVLTDEDDGAERYNALGDTANVAARLQELAADRRHRRRPRDGAPGAVRASSSSRSARSSCADSSARCAPPA